MYKIKVPSPIESMNLNRRGAVACGDARRVNRYEGFYLYCQVLGKIFFFKKKKKYEKKRIFFSQLQPLVHINNMGQMGSTGRYEDITIGQKWKDSFVCFRLRGTIIQYQHN